MLQIKIKNFVLRALKPFVVSLLHDHPRLLHEALDDLFDAHPELLRDTFHDLHNTHPQLLQRAVLDFLRENPPVPPAVNEHMKDPSISARFLPYLPSETTIFVPSEIPYEKTGEHLGLPIPPRPLQLGYGVDSQEYVLLGEKDYT
jgi:hypothetical protein